MRQEEESVCDSYGFQVKKELRHIFAQYEPLLQKEESERTLRWAQFLGGLSAPDGQQQPGDSQQSGGEGAAAQRSLTVLADLMIAGLLDRDESDPDRQQLKSLVQAGIPTEIRGQLWKAFLGVDRKRVPGAYEQLVEAGLQHAAAAAAAKAAADAAAAAANSASSTALHADGRIGVQRAAGASAGLANAGSSSSSLAQQTSGNSDASTVTPFATAAEAETAAGSNLSPGAPAAGASLPRTPAASLKSQPSAADWAIQISKDLHRTFPGHAAMDDNGRAALRRILLAYAQYNPFVGYCQGMNFIAGVLLLFMGEQDVFWCLAAVVEDKLPGYFSVAMVAPQVDQLALNHLVAEQLPTLAALFAGHGIELTSVSMQWFLGVFVNSLPLETGLRVWDLLFLEQRRGGVPVVLFRVGMALLDVYQKALLATEDGMECLELLAQVAGVSFDGSRLVDVACIAFPNVCEDGVAALRDAYRDKIVRRVKDLPLDTAGILDTHAKALALGGDEAARPSVLHSGEPRVIAARQLFGCDGFPPGWSASGAPPRDEEAAAATRAASAHAVSDCESESSGAGAGEELEAKGAEQPCCSGAPAAAADATCPAVDGCSGAHSRVISADVGGAADASDSDEEGALLAQRSPRTHSGAADGNGLAPEPRTMSSTRRDILGRLHGRLGERRPPQLRTSSSYWAAAAAAEAADGGDAAGDGVSMAAALPPSNSGSSRELASQSPALLTSARPAAAAASDSRAAPGSGVSHSAELGRRQQQDGLGGGTDIAQLRGRPSAALDTSGRSSSGAGAGTSAAATGPGSGSWRRVHARAPSKAQIAAYEIAINPAIRELAIAHSFIKAERQHGQQPGGDSPATGGSGASTCSPSPASPAAFSSTTALREGAGGSGAPSDAFPASGAGSPGSSALSPPPGAATSLEQAGAMLPAVLDGLRREVSAAQERRTAAEERAAMLAQTSGLLSDKLERLLQELEERKLTVEELDGKVRETRGELRALEATLAERDGSLAEAAAARDARDAEVAAKDAQIANLQAKVRRFQRRSTGAGVLPPAAAAK